jgi:ribosomal-protein-alanine N-acetyltransferase
VIRDAKPTDAPALASLQSYLDAPSPRLLASFASLGTCLVSVDDAPTGSEELPVGYVLLIGGDDVHLAELVVHPAHRREGRGRALLRAAIDRQESGTRVTLAVAADNDPARSLYESVGFRRIDYRAGFYDAESVEGSRDAVVYAYDAA